MRIEEVSPVEKKLIVTVPWTTVSAKLNDAFRNLGKNVNLKGFRRGKVSRPVLERMFGKRVRAEVAADLVRESFIAATTEHKLEAVAEPRVDEELIIKKGEDFSFEAIVEVRGEVVPKDYTGLPLHRIEASVQDEDLQQAIGHLQRQNTELLPIEGRETLSESDIVAVIVNGSIGEGEDAINLENREMTIDLADDKNEQYPGMVAALVGTPVTREEPLELKLPFPEDYENKELAGKVANLTVEVKDAREQNSPDLDDDFAKDTGKADTLEELETVVRGELAERLADEAKSKEREDILKQLVKRNEVPLATSLIERAVDHKYRQLQMMLGMQPSGEGPSDDLRERLRASAADEVRGQLLLEAIAEKESLEVTDDDVNERVADLAESQNAQPGRLRAEMERDGRLENIQFSLRQDKTLDFLIEKAELVDAPLEDDSASDEDPDSDSEDAPAAPSAGEEE